MGGEGGGLPACHHIYQSSGTSFDDGHIMIGTESKHERLLTEFSSPCNILAQGAEKKHIRKILPKDE